MTKTTMGCYGCYTSLPEESTHYCRYGGYCKVATLYKKNYYATPSGWLRFISSSITVDVDTDVEIAGFGTANNECHFCVT